MPKETRLFIRLTAWFVMIWCGLLWLGFSYIKSPTNVTPQEHLIVVLAEMLIGCMACVLVASDIAQRYIKLSRSSTG